MKRAVVTTTIYPPHNLKQWATCLDEDDVIVVSGDQKTPHDEVITVLSKITSITGVKTKYIPHYTLETRATSEAIGSNSIQRRNIAILEAIRLNVDMITTVDTDNFPRSTEHMNDVEELLGKPWTEHVHRHPHNWLNVGRLLNPNVVHRGFPLSRRIDDNLLLMDRPKKPVRIGVHSSLWVGDPDVDAIERLHCDPVIYADRNETETTIVFEPVTWCPFNSQATTFVRELFPLMNVWPGVGRMDDIWSSYVARHIMQHLDYGVAYGAPFVLQDRHAHNLVTDLENEMFGYHWTEIFLEDLRTIKLTTNDALSCLREVYETLRLRSSVPFLTQTKNFWDAWLGDVETAMGRGKK